MEHYRICLLLEQIRISMAESAEHDDGKCRSEIDQM